MNLREQFEEESKLKKPTEQDYCIGNRTTPTMSYMKEYYWRSYAQWLETKLINESSRLSDDEIEAEFVAEGMKLMKSLYKLKKFVI